MQDGYNALHLAAYGGHIEIVGLLLQDTRITDLNTKDKVGTLKMKF